MVLRGKRHEIDHASLTHLVRLLILAPQVNEDFILTPALKGKEWPLSRMRAFLTFLVLHCAFSIDDSGPLTAVWSEAIFSAWQLETILMTTLLMFPACIAVSSMGFDLTASDAILTSGQSSHPLKADIS